MGLLNEEYSKLEEAWPTYAAELTMCDLLSPIISLNDSSFGAIHTMLKVDWSDKPPKMTREQLSALKPILVKFSGEYLAAEIEDVLEGFSSLEAIVSNEKEIAVTNASHVINDLIVIGSRVLNTKIWKAGVPTFVEKANDLLQMVGGLSKEVLQAKLYNLAGSYKWKCGAYAEAEQFHKDALILTKEKGDLILQAKTYNCLATVYGDWKDSPESSEECTKMAIKLLGYSTIPQDRKKEAKKILASIQNNIGIKLTKKADDAKDGGDLIAYEDFLSKAKSAYTESIKLALEADHSAMVGWAAFNLAETLGYLGAARKEMKLIESAKNFSKKSKVVYNERVKSERLKSGFLMADGVIAMCEGDIYRSDNDEVKARECWQMAIEIHNESIACRRELQEDRRIADGIIGRADVYQRLGDKDKYVADLNEALDLYKKICSEHNINRVEKRIALLNPTG